LGRRRTTLGGVGQLAIGGLPGERVAEDLLDASIERFEFGEQFVLPNIELFEQRLTRRVVVHPRESGNRQGRGSGPSWIGIGGARGPA
jgi:hypothetical protein